ncbi:MAG: hypothetical protein U9N09_06950 [Euryarchaeota archaeon]|nr:hypothetical protein [Euryarchaeota archaeon]
MRASSRMTWLSLLMSAAARVVASHGRLPTAISSAIAASVE